MDPNKNTLKLILWRAIIPLNEKQVGNFDVSKITFLQNTTVVFIKAQNLILWW